MSCPCWRRTAAYTIRRGYAAASSEEHKDQDPVYDVGDECSEPEKCRRATCSGPWGPFSNQRGSDDVEEGPECIKGQLNQRPHCNLSDQVGQVQQQEDNTQKESGHRDELEKAYVGVPDARGKG